MRMFFKRVDVAVVGLALLGCPCLNADSNTTPIKKAPAEAPLSDQALLTLLHADNVVEVKRGQDAENRAVSDDVRHYAQRIEKDDRKADRQVCALAGRLRIKLNSADFLQPVVSNGAFDKSFVQAAADGHQEILNTIDHQRMLLPKDSPVYSLIAYLLPTIRTHYEIALSLETQLAKANDTEEVASLIQSEHN